MPAVPERQKQQPPGEQPMRFLRAGEDPRRPSRGGTASLMPGSRATRGPSRAASRAIHSPTGTVKPSFLANGRGGRIVVGEPSTQQILALAAPQLQPVGQGEAELGHGPVEQRRAAFEAEMHEAAVEADQHRMGQPVGEIHRLGALQRVEAARCGFGLGRRDAVAPAASGAGGRDRARRMGPCGAAAARRASAAASAGDSGCSRRKARLRRCRSARPSRPARRAPPAGTWARWRNRPPDHRGRRRFPAAGRRTWSAVIGTSAWRAPAASARCRRERLARHARRFPERPPCRCARVRC